MSIGFEEVLKRGLILERDKECSKCEGTGLLILQKNVEVPNPDGKTFRVHSVLAGYKVLCTCVKLLDLK